MQRDKNLG